MKLLDNYVLRCIEEDCGQVFQVTHTKSGDVEVCPFCQGDIDYAPSSAEDAFIIAQFNKIKGR